ncbi:hypothetical protein M569_16025, partial [Genlisea aurea]
MIFLDSLMGIIGFVMGIQIGLFLGFLWFIHLQSRDSKKVILKAFNKLDSSSLVDFIHELPLWVMSPDYERVDWLNKFVEDLWPHLDKAGSKILKASAESAFAEYIGKYNIKSIGFRGFTLGTLPPKIHGLKAQESNENEIVMDLEFRWAGNSDIVVAIEVLCIKLEVQIVDIQMSAAMRIILKPFVPTFPCFCVAAVSLMEKPKIDFGIKVIGADIMSIPGLYHAVQEIVARQVAKLYLWPQSFDLAVLDET